MRAALDEAMKALDKHEVPIGAVVVANDMIIARAHNLTETLNDPTAHAEILVLRKGGEVLKNYRLDETVVYVTAEPCPMCASAMVHSRISRLVFGTYEPKFGAVQSKFKLLNGNGVNHRVKTDRGILERECAEILKSFFKEKRLSK